MGAALEKRLKFRKPCLEGGGETGIMASLSDFGQGFYVEVTGVTGAGKTTWARQAIDHLKGLGHVFETNHPTRFQVAGLRGYERLSPTRQNLALEMAGLPYLLKAPSLWPFFFWCSSSIIRSGLTPASKAACLRGVLRKVGSHRRWRVKLSNVFHDEGPVHAVNNVLVTPNALPGEPEVRRFAEMVPLPDLIVYIQVAPEIAIARTLARPDPPMALAGEELRRLVANAYSVFNVLLRHPRIAPRVIRVANPADSHVAIDFIAGEMARR
jgi:hypothetical protein